MNLKDKIKNAANNLSSLDLFPKQDKEFIVNLCNDFNSRVKVIKAYFDFSEKANLELKELKSKVDENGKLGRMYFLPNYDFSFNVGKSYEMLVSEFLSVTQSYFSEKYMLGKFLESASKHDNGLQISYVQPNELNVNEIAKILYSFMNNAPFELLASVNIKNIALGIIALENVKVSKRSVILTKCLYVNNYRGNASFQSQDNFHYFLCALMLHYDLRNISKIAYDNKENEYFIDYLGHTYYINIINNFEVDLPQMNMRFIYNKLGTCTFEFENENALQNFLTFLKS